MTAPKNENMFALTIVDHLSWFVIASPLLSKTFDSVATGFLKLVVFIFGSPKLIMGDNGPEFKSKSEILQWHDDFLSPYYSKEILG